MTAQRLTVDHVGVIVPDLDIARADYASLGFRLTRRSSHKGRLTPDGPVEPWGSGNHCAMFRDGYLEILGVTDPSKHHAHVTARLARYHGLQLIALGCEAADGLQQEVSARAAGVRRISELGRDVPYDDGTRPGVFRIVHLDDAAFPEAELFFIEHATPDVLWQPSLLDHPNGVTGLAGVLICSADPASTCRRLEQLTAVTPTGQGDEMSFALNRGHVTVATPQRVTSRFASVSVPAVPCVAAATLTVADLDATRAYLQNRGIGVEDAGGRVWVGPEWAGGAVLEFVPQTADPDPR